MFKRFKARLTRPDAHVFRLSVGFIAAAVLYIAYEVINLIVK